MAEADWTQLSGGIGSGSLLQGVTAGVPAPNGGGSFIYGFASLDTTTGAAGLFVNATNFAPNTGGVSGLGGGSVTAAVQRGVGGGNTGFSPWIFVCGQTTTVGGKAYLLGLADSDPSRIVLVKGILSAGIPGTPVATPPINGVLAASNETYPVGTWLHIRLDAVVNANGDVVLNCFQNDLTANPVTAPGWSLIPGISEFIDDALQVNTGSAPLVQGYLGFGFNTSNVTRRGYFDQLTVVRQTS